MLSLHVGMLACWHAGLLACWLARLPAYCLFFLDHSVLSNVIVFFGGITPVFAEELFISAAVL